MKQFIQPATEVSTFVKRIVLLEDDRNIDHSLPFFASGYPGIVFSETDEAMLLQPFNKLLSNFFLFGQTIEPIQIQIRGAYKMVVFQLYPFATRLLLGIDPATINDACVDLTEVAYVDTKGTIEALDHATPDRRIALMSEYVLALIRHSSRQPDNSIKLAISTILKAKGAIRVRDLRERLFITERTFERRFASEIGVTPKQFSRIIQFRSSLAQIEETDYASLTAIAYDNGFSDQSHFIKAFRQFTGATPKEWLSRVD